MTTGAGGAELYPRYRHARLHRGLLQRPAQLHLRGGARAHAPAAADGRGRRRGSTPSPSPSRWRPRTRCAPSPAPGRRRAAGPSPASTTRPGRRRRARLRFRRAARGGASTSRGPAAWARPCCGCAGRPDFLVRLNGVTVARGGGPGEPRRRPSACPSRCCAPARTRSRSRAPSAAKTPALARPGAGRVPAALAHAAALRFAAARCRRYSTNAGITETAMMPRITRSKFFLTMGMLPKK